ncbi:MAG: fructose bisphosphate aldolase [Treponema sp.]
MDSVMYGRMKDSEGFIAALDQSGGSTPKALMLYGIPKESYSSEDEMFDLVHEMRTRIITSPSFSSDRIIAAILFEMTMDRTIEGLPTADFLWQKKGIVPFLKIDKGLEDSRDGIRLMKDIPNLEQTLSKALSKHIFGTKMRSVIEKATAKGIKEVVAQQFELALKILDAGLIPIIEPEVDIHCPEKETAEGLLREELKENLKKIPKGKTVMFKLTIPTRENLYEEFTKDEKVLRVVALSGGYSRDEANTLLAKNRGVIASFSRALTEGLSHSMSDGEFDKALASSVLSIYNASKY